MVFDGHSDLLVDVTRRRKMGEQRVLERHHLQYLREGGVEGLTLAIWAHPGWGESYAEATEQILISAKEEFAECPWLEIVQTRTEAEAAHTAGKMYAFLSVEGMAAVGERPELLERYAALGVRTGMLTWNEENLLATGAGGDPRRGLTALGRQTVRRMRELNILVDVSHLNDGGFRDVIALAGGPVIASHSNCRDLCDVPRNLTDDQLRAIRDTGGVVGVNVHHAFVHADAEKQTVETLARHAVHMAEIMGVEHVACGFDFCEYFIPPDRGVAGMENCASIGNFFDELEKLGMSERERRMIARENLLRLL